MEAKNIYLLLKIVKYNGNTKRLVHENLNFREIADLTNFAITKGLIVFNDYSLILSDMGEDEYYSLSKKFKESNKDKWIEKEKKSVIPRIGKDFIFLPNQNDLDF